MRDMPAPKGDPGYIKDKDRYFMNVAKAIERGSTHPLVPGGCVLVRDRERLRFLFFACPYACACACACACDCACVCVCV